MTISPARLPLVVGYATVAAMLPYLAIKTAWLAGSDIGVTDPGLMRAPPFVVGNLVTAGGFIVQGVGLAVAFMLYLRKLWGGILGGRVGSRRPGATHGVQVMSTVAAGGLTALVVAVRLYWAAGGEAGLPGPMRAVRSLTQQVLDASSAALALAGVLALVILVHRRPPGLRVRVPVAAVWVGAGSMVCSGAYQLVILLAPGSPVEGSGGGFALVVVAQMIAGVVIAVTGAFHLAEAGTTGVPVRMGDGRKPLTSSQTLSENSQMASGAVSATGSPEVMSQAPSSTPIPARSASGPPIRPIHTIGRGSSLDRHIR
jgi:hypothetical protein